MPFTALPSFEQIEQIARWLFGDAMSWANIAQVPALLLTGAVAWLLCHPVRAKCEAWINRHPDHHRLDWLVLHRPLAAERLVPVLPFAGPAHAQCGPGDRSTRGQRVG